MLKGLNNERNQKCMIAQKLFGDLLGMPQKQKREKNQLVRY